VDNTEKETVETRDKILREGLKQSQAEQAAVSVEMDVENVPSGETGVPSSTERMASNAREQATAAADALRRGEAYKEAGADMIFIHTRDPEEMRIIGERLPAPLMIFAPEDGYAASPMSPADLAGLGFRLAASSGSAFVAMYKAIRQSYECLASGTIDPFLGPGGTVAEMKEARRTAGLDELLEIEKRTMGGA